MCLANTQRTQSEMMNKMATQYYPSNGTEGEGFISKWCENCKRDPASRNVEAKTMCRIFNNSLLGKQPKQWIYQNGIPTCTSFLDYRFSKQVHKKRVVKYQTRLF
jgi:hypothetical protein